MNKSEKLLSAFSEDYFFKELVLEDLRFTPIDDTEKELADLLINMGDIIIAIQLKARDDKGKTGDKMSEAKWLQKKGKLAKGQIKDTLQFILSGTLPSFHNKRNQLVEIRPDAEIIPLVVFDNEQIGEYPPLLKKHSETGMSINCMSFSDFCEMCRVLVTPMEIVEYLEYRKLIYEEQDDIDIMILNGRGNELVLTRPKHRESLVHTFLAEKYGIKASLQHTKSIQCFRNFLHLLPDRISNADSMNNPYKIMLFLAHLHRDEIVEFWKLFEDTKTKAKKGKKGILHSLRNERSEYVILFAANDMVPMKELLPVIGRKTIPTQVMEMEIHWFDKKSFGIDFLFWDKSI